MAFLVHADGAIHAVVDQDHDNRQLILDGGGEFLAMHHEAAIAGEAYYGFRGVDPFGAHCRGQAIAHGARGGRQLRAVALERGESDAARWRSCPRHCT